MASLDAEQLDIRASYYCASELIRSRQRLGQPVPPWLRQHYNRLDAAIRMSPSGHAVHEIGCDTGQSEDEGWISSRESAELLRLSARQVQRIADDLRGKIVGGRWVFRRAAVIEYRRKKVA